MLKYLLSFLLCVCLNAQEAWAPRYVVRFEMKQSHFTLDLSQHMKDSMNKVTFDIPVDKKYFDSVKVGDSVVDKFRTGSLVLFGSFGNWKVTVVGKAVY